LAYTRRLIPSCLTRARATVSPEEHDDGVTKNRGPVAFYGGAADADGGALHWLWLVFIRPLLRYWEPIAIFVSGYLAGVYVTNHARGQNQVKRQFCIDPRIKKILEVLGKAIAIPLSLVAAVTIFGTMYVTFSGIWKPLPWFYRPQDYPKPVLAKIRAMPPLAITIANRWMRGWPKVVKMHLKSGNTWGS